MHQTRALVVSPHSKEESFGLAQASTQAASAGPALSSADVRCQCRAFHLNIPHSFCIGSLIFICLRTVLHQLVY
ncbi:hypothetical protein N656DRAFT_566350 [Canariomyces notabilis]|uniref:Uncharacterized protein n=1 Tax=Canariomyces notabilis TaxID=2074819 RepID=A0AAN6YU19_9PEZI|nr:hypothetical protein N656DRAFT_566350 [Canariomyces arenarius]